MALKLVSFTTCPFVQRAVLMLREKSVDFEVEYIDLRNKPAWFLELSPRGKVPVLVTEGKDVLFESQAICEYLEEEFPEPRLAASDPVGRARDRAWFAFAGEDLFMPLYRLETAMTKEVAAEVQGKLRPPLERLNQEVGGRQWLSGDGTRFGMAEVAMASALFRIADFRTRGVDLLTGLDSLRAWSDRVLARPSVQASVPDSWKVDHEASMRAAESIFARAA